MKSLADIVDNWGGGTLLTLSEVPSFEGELKIRLVRKLRLIGPPQFFRQSQDAWPLVLRHLDIVCPFAVHRMPPGDITGEESAAIWQRMCDQAGSHLWMDMEAFLFEGKALIPRPIAGLIQDLIRFPNFEKILCYQYPGIFNSPATGVKPGGARTVVLYREYQQYLKNLHTDKSHGRALATES